MNKEQMLLLKVAEECNEIAQVCSKAIRFGLESKHPSGGPTNLERIGEEFEDLLVALKMLFGEDYTINHVDYVEYDTKRVDRVNKYLQVSRDLGILKD